MRAAIHHRIRGKSAALSRTSVPRCNGLGIGRVGSIDKAQRSVQTLVASSRGGMMQGANALDGVWGVGKSRMMMRSGGQRSVTSFLDLNDDLDAWPRSKPNTILNICPQGETMVVERLGKMYDMHSGGWFFAIPIIDQVQYVVDMREKALSITPQHCITKDNVTVAVSGVLYCQFVDAERAAYGSKNPIYSVKQHAQSSMRAAIGEMELDEILRARAELNTIIRSSVQEASTAWGLDIKRYEITDVTPDKAIIEAMSRQAAAERERRSSVLEAEGRKKAAVLDSEGEKIRLVNKSEGELISVENAAKARKVELMLLAEGEADAIQRKADAQAMAIKTVAAALSAESGDEAAKINIARNYIDMYADIGSKSNTMIFNSQPADINALLAQASAVIDSAKSVGTSKVNDGARKV